MKVIGITGGVGAGKSTLLSLLDEMEGTVTVQADLIAREAMKKGGIAYEKTVFLFGADILGPDGEIDRAKLGEIVFKEDNKRLVLNSIVHPVVKNEIIADIQEKENEGKSFYFIEAALLLEDRYERICDEIWYVYAGEELRRERLKKNRGYTDEKIDGLFASQMKDEYIRRKYLKNDSGEEIDTGIARFDMTPPWLVFDNSTGLFLTPEFFDILDKLLVTKEEIAEGSAEEFIEETTEETKKDVSEEVQKE